VPCAHFSLVISLVTTSLRRQLYVSFLNSSVCRSSRSSILFSRGMTALTAASTAASTAAVVVFVDEKVVHHLVFCCVVSCCVVLLAWLEDDVIVCFLLLLLPLLLHLYSRRRRTPQFSIRVQVVRREPLAAPFSLSLSLTHTRTFL